MKEMEFIKEGKREGHSYEVDKIYTLKDLDDTLKEQAEDIKGWMKFFGIELTEGQERDYKQRYLEPKDSGTTHKHKWGGDPYDWGY